MVLVNIGKQKLFLLLFLLGFQEAKSQVWTLQQCIDTANVYNKNLQVSRNNVSLGEQKEKELKAGLIPKVMANTDYRYYTNLPYQLMPLSAFGGPEGEYRAIQFGVPNLINANLQFSMALYNPHVYGSIQSSKLGSELLELQYRKTEEQIYFEISNLYYNAQILQHQLTFIDSNLINSEIMLEKMVLLNKQLLAKESDVSKVKLQVAQNTTLRENFGSKYDQVLNMLKFAMGIQLEQNLKIDPTIQYQKKSEYTQNSTLDIRIVEIQNRLLSNELITLNRSKNLPSLNLVGTYGTTGFGYNGLPTSFLDFYTIGFAGLQLSQPLFNGTVTQRKINQKKIELQNSELQFGLFTEQNSMLSENAMLQGAIAQNSIETTRKQVELAKTIYKQTILQQELETASLTDVLLADNALREAQQNYLSAIIDYLKSDLEIKKLTGNISTTK